MSPIALLGLLLCTILRKCSARCWIPVLCGSSQTCPPNGFDAVPNFDVKAYISAPWYPQKQIPLIYQREEDLYCVQAQYKAINPDKPAEGLYVYNTAKKGGVNGSSVGSTAADQFQLVALPDHNNPHPAKLLVGPKALSFARSLAYGPYWIVAVGNTSNASSASNSSNATLKYDWAVVSGGSPEYKSGSACSTFLPVIPTTWQYRGGLWLFTRKSVDPVASAAAAAAAQGLGFDVGKLVDVKQAGCVYPPRIA